MICSRARAAAAYFCHSLLAMERHLHGEVGEGHFLLCHVLALGEDERNEQNSFFILNSK